MKRVAIITSSDSGYRGEREDLSGPVIKEMVENTGYEVISMEILPDDKEMLKKTHGRKFADKGEAELILTTGGTGFSPRDVMPEATEENLRETRSGDSGGNARLQYDDYKTRYVKQKRSGNQEKKP